MNCPRCGKPIGGYVQAGSKGASRVSQGRCPHCGGSMPRGYRVGFANDFKPQSQPKYYNADAVREVGKTGPYKGVCTILNGVLGGLFSILNHHIVIGIIFAVVVIAAAVLYYFMWSDMPMFDTYDFRRGVQTNKTKQSPINNGLMIVSLFAGLGVSLATCASASLQPDRSRLYWIIGTFVFSLILQAFTWRHTYKWAIGAAAKRKEKEKEKEFLEYFLNQMNEGRVKCGECENTIKGRYSMALKGNGAIVLCDNCFPWKENGSTEVGDLTFYHSKR